MHPCTKIFAGFALIASTVLSSCSGHPAIVSVDSNEKEDSDIDACVIEVVCNEPELDHLSGKIGKAYKFYDFCDSTVTIVSPKDATAFIYNVRSIADVKGTERKEMEAAAVKYQALNNKPSTP